MLRFHILETIRYFITQLPLRGEGKRDPKNTLLLYSSSHVPKPGSQPLHNLMHFKTSNYKEHPLVNQDRQSGFSKLLLLPPGLTSPTELRQRP